MAKTISFILLFCAFMISNASTSSSTNTLIPTKLVDGVCNKTSNYSFCLNSLYSDSRTGDADAYTLCFIAVGLAYANATDTQAFISDLINKESGKEEQLLRLERCSNDYNTTSNAFAMAYNDLNSETFFELEDLSGKASDAAKDCESAFKGIPSPPLSSRNGDIVGLSQIVGIVGNLFTGGGD